MKNIIYVLSITLLATIYLSIGRMNDFGPINFVFIFLLIIIALTFNLVIIFLSRRYKYMFLLILIVDFWIIFIQDNKDQLVLYLLFGILILTSIIHYLLCNKIIKKKDVKMSLNVYISSYNSVLIIAVLMDYVWKLSELISNDKIYIDFFELIFILVIFNFLNLLPLYKLKKFFI